MERDSVNNISLQNLLVKYIQYIKDIEGTDYILIHDERFISDVKFTDIEWDLLVEIAKKL